MVAWLPDPFRCEVAGMLMGVIVEKADELGVNVWCDKYDYTNDLHVSAISTSQPLSPFDQRSIHSDIF